AAASDSVGVAGVQFKLDGVNLGTEKTTVPYSITWDTTVVTTGPHTLTAVARNTVGNQTASSPVTVTVLTPGITLVDFGATSAGTTFGLAGWSTAIKDVNTDYQDIGPGGTTIVVDNDATANYQGVTGSPRNFAAGEKIRVTWYNNSANNIAFTPN